MHCHTVRNLIRGDAIAEQLALAGDSLGCERRIRAITKWERVETRVTYMGIAETVGTAATVRLIRTIAALSADDQMGPLATELQHALRTPPGVDLAHQLYRTLFAAWAEDASLPLTAADADALRSLTEWSGDVTPEQVHRAIGCLRTQHQHGKAG